MQDSYGPPDVPQIQPVVQVHQTYGIPESHTNHQDNHIHIEESHGHEEHGHSESHSESHGESQGNNLSGGYELPHVNDAPLFDNALGALGIQSSGNDEQVIQSNIVHESHTSEVSFSHFIPLIFYHFNFVKKGDKQLHCWSRFILSTAIGLIPAWKIRSIFLEKTKQTSTQTSTSATNSNPQTCSSKTSPAAIQTSSSNFYINLHLEILSIYFFF